MKRVLLVIVAAVMAFSMSSANGVATQAKAGCNWIHFGEPLVFYKHNMHCGKAKRYARRLHGTGGAAEPPHFYCNSSTGYEEQGACHHNRKDKYFGWHSTIKR